MITIKQNVVLLPCFFISLHCNWEKIMRYIIHLIRKLGYFQKHILMVYEVYYVTHMIG